MDLEDFNTDRKTIDAVVRNFEIIGEASKFMPEDIKKNYQNVDWKGIVGLRNRIAHEPPWMPRKFHCGARDSHPNFTQNFSIPSPFPASFSL